MKDIIREILSNSTHTISINDATDKILTLFAEREKLFQILLEDTATEDAEIRKLAMTVLPKEQVEGDSFGVPSVVDVVELLVQQLKIKGGNEDAESRSRNQ